jgi:CheY-like chemotaxis protein
MPVHVLVVDDDEMSRELLSVVLEAQGYAVESANSGDSALAHLRSSNAHPDLILSDMQMPGTTGSALATELRSVAGNSTVLLAMSGSQPAQDAVSQFDGFLMKPFKVEQLAETVDRIRRHRSQISPRRATPPGKVVPISSASMDSPASAAKATAALAVAEPETVAPVLNDQIYEQLTRTMLPQQLSEMYSLCINDTRERIHRMRGSAEDHDDARFVRDAHAIKGSAGMLGATQIHTMASELETRGLDGAEGTSATVNSLDELSAACDRLERMLGTRA